MDFHQLVHLHFPWRTHAGPRFYALLPWLAAISMLVALISGVVGKRLLKKSYELLNDERSQLYAQGIPGPEVEQKIYFAAIATREMQQWRSIHKPITLLFATLTLLHILSTIVLFTQGVPQ